MVGSTSAGSIGLDVKLNSKSAERQVSSIASKLGGILSKGLAFGTIGAGTFALFSKRCVSLGSDLAEVQNVVDVTFKSMSGAVDEWAKSAAMSYGLSETMAKRYVGTFGSMAEAFGFSEKEAYEMSTTLTGLAGDIASFYNISQDLAYTKLKSVFSGETESLKDLGIVMTQTALDEYALANGFGKTTSAMSEAEKVSLRYAFIQDQLANATGDFARTSNSWANQTRILSLQMESLGANIGQGLIAVLTPAIQALNAFMAKLVQASETFKNFLMGLSLKGKVGGAAKSALSGFSGTLKGAISGPGTKLKKSLSGVGKAASSASSGMVGLGKSSGSAGKAAKKAAKDLKKAQRELMGFDKINKLSKKQESEGTSGGGGGGGAGLGGGAADLDGLALAAGNAQKEVDKVKLPPKLLKALDHMHNSLGKLFDIAKRAGKWTLDNVLKPLGKWTISELVPALIEVLASAFDVLAAVLEGLRPAAQFIWEHFLKPLAKFTGKTIVMAIEGIAGAFQMIADFADAHPKLFSWIVSLFAAFIAGKGAIGFVKGFSEGIGGLDGALKVLSKFLAGGWIGLAITAVVVGLGYIYKNWDKIKKTKIGKAIIKVGKTLKEFGEYLSKRFGKFIKGASESIAAFKESWNAIKDRTAELKAKVDDAATSVIVTLKEDWEAIKDKAATLKATVQNASAKVLETLKNGWTKITDKTATLKAKVGTTWGNLKAKWNTLMSHFKNKTVSIGLKFSAAAQDLKNWINSHVIDRINSKFKKVPVLKNHLIPRLAEGGYVARNTPRLAVIGDNRYEGEITSPESKLQAMANQAARASGSRDDEIVALLRTLISEVKSIDSNTYLDGEKITRKVVGNINRTTRATGQSPILL